MEKIEHLCKECGRLIEGDEDFKFCPYCDEAFDEIDDYLIDWNEQWVTTL